MEKSEGNEIFPPYMFTLFCVFCRSSKFHNWTFIPGAAGWLCRYLFWYAFIVVIIACSFLPILTITSVVKNTKKTNKCYKR